jgi:hypothetical protein
VRSARWLRILYLVSPPCRETTERVPECQFPIESIPESLHCPISLPEANRQFPGAPPSACKKEVRDNTVAEQMCSRIRCGSISGCRRLWFPLPFVAMAETAERVFGNRIGELDSYSLGFLLSAKRSGKPRSERQLSSKQKLLRGKLSLYFRNFCNR